LQGGHNARDGTTKVQLRPDRLAHCRDQNHNRKYDRSHPGRRLWAKLVSGLMNDFGVLTKRKRAFIALIHSVVFLGIAIHGLVSPKPGILATIPVATADLVLIGVYLTVACILAWLVGISRCLIERLYFILCSASASCGLLRTVFGDATLPAVPCLRVAMLTSAVIVGTLIFRSFTSPAAEGQLSR
jgi:hypothetical protein